MEKESISFDITLTAKDLYLFTMRHTYVSVSGVFSLLISFGALALAVLRFGRMPMSSTAVLILVAVLFTIIQPILLYAKCVTQMKQSKDINATLHYSLSEEGIFVQQNEDLVKIKWYEIRKAVYCKQGIYIYMSPVRAFIFPKGQCEEQFDKMQRMIKEQMERYKDYEPAENEKQEDNHG